MAMPCSSIHLLVSRHNLSCRSSHLQAGDTEVDISEGDPISRHYPPTSTNRPRKTSLSLPVAEAGESADDEDEPAPAGEAVAWKHTDRALNARLSRQEQLEREKAVIDDALRTR